MFQVQMPYTSPLLAGLTSGINAGSTLAQLPSRLAYQKALTAHQQAVNALPFGGAYASGNTAIPSMLMSLQQQGGNPVVTHALQQQMLADIAYKNALALNMGTNTQLKNLPGWAKTSVLKQQASTGGNLADNQILPQGGVKYTPASQVPPQMNPLQGLQPTSAAGGASAPAAATNAVPNQTPAPTQQQSLYSQPNAPSIGQNQGLTPQQQTVANSAGMAQLKETAPANVMKRLPFANQLEVTMNNVPLDSLTYYAGPGKARFAKDLIQYNQNPQNAPQAMIDYQNFVNTMLPMIGKQSTQFWGSSIRPKAVQQTEDMVFNPKNWLNNPTNALAQFQNYRNVIGQEVTNLKQSAVNPDIYTGASNVLPTNPITGRSPGNQAQQINQAARQVTVGSSPSMGASMPNTDLIAAEIARRQKAGSWK